MFKNDSYQQTSCIPQVDKSTKASCFCSIMTTNAAKEKEFRIQKEFMATKNISKEGRKKRIPRTC